MTEFVADNADDDNADERISVDGSNFVRRDNSPMPIVKET
jgi:hypothetical protein